jgi:hypothetical protein
MSYERGRAAINLQAPEVIPHTQYISNQAYIAHLQETTGKGPAAALDYDFIWSTSAPPVPREEGRWTDMGRAYWHDGQQEQDSRHLGFADAEEALALDVAAEYGRPEPGWCLEHYRQRYREGQEANPFAVFPVGTYRTQVSFAIAAFGWDMLLEMAGLDPRNFARLLEEWCEILKVHYAAMAETDAEVILTHDDMVWTQGPFMRPEVYREVIFPNYREIWSLVKDAGKKVLFCSDGDFTTYVDDVAEAGADGFIFEPVTDLDYVVKNYGRTHVIIGNADCRVLTFGSEEDSRAEVRRVMERGRDCPGYFFAVGNHMPDNIPLANCIAAMDEYFQRRER